MSVESGGGEALSPGDAALVRLSAALAAAGADAAGPALLEALEDARRHAGAGQVEEALLQSHLFLGYPAALNAFARWRELTGEPAGAGSSVGGTTDGAEDWTVRGEEVCRRVYAGQYDGLRGNVRALHPDMERWMVRDGYGRVLGRPGLSLAARELCVVGVLVVAGAQTQLYSHLRGALNVGASPEAVAGALAVALPFADAARRAAAEVTWRAVRGRMAGGRSPSDDADRSD